ncbi:MAG: DUF4279 domain-containing protein [Verrucomicrobiaceae bacterium]|nr:MAG: DUF4279 domain-containing protein [Verrucomicrobiaceae bacterium]
MAQLHMSAVTLRICGDDLISDEITRLLGASPTRAQTKGDEIRGNAPGKVRIAKAGMWRLSAVDREPEDIDGQIREILSLLTNDLAVWQNITNRYRADLFCGLFLKVSNEGLSISATSLEALGARGIELSLDIYGGSDEEDGTSI